MAELKGLMLSLSRIHSSPARADRGRSHHLAAPGQPQLHHDDHAVVDTGARTLTCARAGHTPFIRVPAGAPGERSACVLAPDGMVMGLNLDNGERFERALHEVSIPLVSGDLFFFFTDGVSEAMDGKDGDPGAFRDHVFLEAHADEPPR
jgi:hypothetical protein